VGGLKIRGSRRLRAWMSSLPRVCACGYPSRMERRIAAPVHVNTGFRAVSVGGEPAEEASAFPLKLERIAVEFACESPLLPDQPVVTRVGGAYGERELRGVPTLLASRQRDDGTVEHIYRLEATWRFPARRAGSPQSTERSASA
jgi:hypothetical protein